MFIIIGEFEDMAFNAKSGDGKTWTVSFTDVFTKQARVEELTALQLSYVVQFNLHEDGEPEGFEKMYEALEPIFKSWPTHMRPIP